MKIIIIGTAYPYRGGLATFNERLAREFNSEKNEVEMYTFTLQYPSILFPGKTQFSSEPVPDDLKIKRTINSINPLTWIKTGREIKKKQPDLVIFAYWMSFMAPCFGTIAKYIRSSKTTILGLVHNMIPHEPNFLDRILPRYFVKNMDGFIAMADSVVKDINLLDKKNKPKAVSPHPIYDHYGGLISKEEAANYLGLSTKENYLLFFGFIRKYKGLDLLLEAFADKRIKALPLHLIIAGEFYDDPEPYMKQIKEAGLENKIELRSDFIPDEEVKYYFSIADLIVQPYRTATQSGVSQVAYHFEKPMLVTNVGGLAEIVPHNKVGYVVEPVPGQIADAIMDFYTKNRGKEFIQNIKLEKRKYEWSKMTQTITELSEEANRRKLG